MLRLWLSLAIEYEGDRAGPPLPNLDFKVLCGDSLLGPDPSAGVEVQGDLLGYDAACASQPSLGRSEGPTSCAASLGPDKEAPAVRRSSVSKDDLRDGVSGSTLGARRGGSGSPRLAG